MEYSIHTIPYFTDANELGKILSYIEPDVIITDKLDLIHKFKNKFKLLKPNELLSGKEVYIKKINPNQIAALYYSSGTTGDPKGVLYSHKNIVSLIKSIIKNFKFSNKDRQLAFLPFGHTASINYNILPSACWM